VDARGARRGSPRRSRRVRADELEAAARAGNLAETHTFEGKRQPPVQGKNASLAEDVCSRLRGSRCPAFAASSAQVTIGKDRRYYGRGDTGNRRLSESEVARLYERRQRTEVDRDELLRAAIYRSPESLEAWGLGVMNAFACPVLRTGNFP